MNRSTPDSALAPTEALERIREFLHETPHHAALVLDASGTILWCNPAAQTIFDDTLVGNPISGYFVEEDVQQGVPEFEIHVARTVGHVENDRWMRRADGSRFWAEGTTVGLGGEGAPATGFLKMLRNRTVQKMAIETLRNHVEESAGHAHQYQQAMATLAHELRNPLSTLRTCCDLLDQLPSEDPRAADARGMLTRNIGYAFRLVEDLLQATRGATGRMSLQVGTVRVADVLRASIAAAQDANPGAPRRIDLLLPESPLQVEGDPLRLQQVFVNLVGNAIRYTQAGGRIIVSAVGRDGMLMAKVEDNGVGIAPEQLDSIFEMFAQGREASMRGGLGIGLALVKQIVELHGGSIQAQSDGPGKGSKFLVNLPMRQGSANAPVGDG